MEVTAYISKTDKQLSVFRSKLLGLDRKLTSVLPSNLSHANDKQKAEYISALLLFCLMDELSDTISSDEISRCRDWLREITLFLFLRCNPDDWTVGNISRVASLTLSTRAEMFRDLFRRFPRVSTETHSPFTESEFESALVRFLNPAQMQQNLEQLKTLVS